MRLSEVSTPALCVDLDAFERNLERMHSFFASVPCNLRPHFKANKTPAIAHRQDEAGCAGFTTATLGEAELLADEGFDDILIANEICDPTKMERMRELAARIPLIVAVDSPLVSLGSVRLGRIMLPGSHYRIVGHGPAAVALLRSAATRYGEAQMKSVFL